MRQINKNFVKQWHGSYVLSCMTWESKVITGDCSQLNMRGVTSRKVNICQFDANFVPVNPDYMMDTNSVNKLVNMSQRQLFEKNIFDNIIRGFTK